MAEALFAYSAVSVTIVLLIILLLAGIVITVLVVVRYAGVMVKLKCVAFQNPLLESVLISDEENLNRK